MIQRAARHGEDPHPHRSGRRAHARPIQLVGREHRRLVRHAFAGIRARVLAVDTAAQTATMLLRAEPGKVLIVGAIEDYLPGDQ